MNDSEKLEIVLEALNFYADAKTYFAIGFIGGSPCGDFIHDFDHHPSMQGTHPGKRAREALAKIVPLTDKVIDPVSGGFVLCTGDASVVLMQDNTWRKISELKSNETPRDFGGCIMLGNGQLVLAKEALNSVDKEDVELKDKLAKQHALRGSGRTTSQLKSLTGGGVYVVHSDALVEHIKDLCDEHCQLKIHIITADQILNNPEMLAGLNSKIEVDHAVHEHVSLDKLEELYIILEKYRAHK